MDSESRRKILGMTPVFFYILLIVIVTALIITAISLAVEGPINSIHYQNVKHSQGYIESHNDQMRQMIAEYNASELKLAQYSDNQAVVKAVKGQMSAILNDIKAKAGELSTNEVAPDVSQFIAMH